MAKRPISSSQNSQETERIKIRAAAELELRGRIGTFQSFVSQVKPNYSWHRHNLVVADCLEKIQSGEIKRLMIFEPPRHGKSEEASRLFPAYYLSRNPNKTVGLTSYAAELAHSLSRDARDNYRRAGMEVRDDVSAARDWLTMRGGGMWSAGVGGAITGRGGDVLIIDDPIANAEDAYSQTMRNNAIRWWESTFYTRLEPGGAIILIQTRWHMNDLAGYLLEREASEPMHWHIVNFPAIKEQTPIEFPPTCTVSPDWRITGQSLCPERFDEKTLLSIKGQSPTFWVALYQQRPSLEEGNIWKRGWFKSFDRLNGTKLYDVGTDWDLAYTKDDQNSASAYIEAGRDNQGNIFITDLDFRWLEYPEMIKWMKERRAPHYVEAKASGKSAVQSLKRDGISAYEVQVSGVDYIARARIATPAAEMGKVYVDRRIVERLLDDPKQGLVHFPNAPQTELNDVFVQMINRLYTRGMNRSDLDRAVIAESVTSQAERF